MIQAIQRSLTTAGVSVNGAPETADAAAPTTTQPDHSPAGTGNADPLAKFDALFGAPAHVQSFYADKNGGHSAGPAKHARSATPAAAPPPSAPAAPVVFDIANTTDAQIKELRNKGQDQLANTIKNAQAAYGDFLAKNPDVKILVTTSDGNGGHPVLIARGADYAKGAHVHTHYHGDNATVGDPLGSKAGTNARIRDTLTRDPRAVFILPEAANSTAKPDSPHNDNSYSVNWRDVKSQVQTTDDALKAAGVSKVDETVVSFHSGGGMVINNLMLADPSGSRLKADRVELYDCVYHFGKEQDTKYFTEDRLREWSQTANGKAVGRVVYYRGTNDAGRAKMVGETFQGKFTLIDMDNEPKLRVKGKIDETVDPPATDANGKLIGTYNYKPNPHYRTTGEFLGTTPRS